MSANRLLLLPALAAAASAGCGGSGPDQGGSSPPVTGTVQLERPRAGAPDAGTAAGHGNDGAVAMASSATYAFTGRVQPPDSAVEVAGRSGVPGAVVVEPSGRFSAAISDLRPGANHVRLRASRPGRAPWRLDIRVVRASVVRVQVPAQDATPPIATLSLRPPGGTQPVLTVSPAARGDRMPFVELERPSFEATGYARDDDGGTGRVRVWARYTTRCGDRATTVADIRPPAQIENIALAPGTSAPAERARRVTVRLKAGEGCTADGEVSVEATNAHGLQAVSRHVRFRYRP